MADDTQDFDLNTEQGKAKALDALLNDAEGRKELLKFYSKKHPDAYIPELKIEEKLQNIEKLAAEKIDKLEQTILELKSQLSLSEQRNKLASSGIDPKEVEKTMLEKKIADYDTAIEHLRLQQAAKPPEVNADNFGIRLPNDEDILKNPDRIPDEVFRAWNDITSGRVKLS